MFYLQCEPEPNPAPRRGEPRKAKARTVTVPVALSRAIVTPALLRALTRLGAEWTGAHGEAALAMLDSDGTMTVTRIAQVGANPQLSKNLSRFA